MDWRAQPAPVKDKPQEEEEEIDQLDESEEESDEAPKEFFKDARDLLPTVSTRLIMMAWDKSSGIGVKGVERKEIYNLGSVRVQAAVGFLIDLNSSNSTSDLKKTTMDKNNNDTSIPIRSPSSSPVPPAASSSSQKEKDKPLFRASSPDILLEEEEEDSSSSDVEIQDVVEIEAKKRSEAKGKGKAREAVIVKQEVILLSDDSDDDHIEIFAQPTKSNRGSSSKSRLQPLPERPLIPSRDRFARSPAPLARWEPLEESEAVQMILSIIPDVLPSHIRNLLRSEDYNNAPNSVVEQLLLNSNYPKKEVVAVPVISEKKAGKKRAREEVRGVGGGEKDYLVIKGRTPGDAEYLKACLEQLYVDFDTVKSDMIRNVFKINSNFYPPTYINLTKIVKREEYEPMSRPRPAKKLKDSDTEETFSKELELEKKWLKKNLIQEKEDSKIAKKLKKQQELDKKNGLLVECSCCFGEFVFDRLIPCTEGHLFCRECVSNLVKTQIGNQQFALDCMTGECSGYIREVDAGKVVSSKSLAGLQKIRMEKEIDQAGLEGLSKCPFCPYAVMIENENERLFTCMREGCLKVTCRQCHRIDHLPRTCKEAKKDDNLGVVHGVEEAMSQALIRKCPKCSTNYLKAEGCNLICCSSCGTKSCFICRKIIPSSEGHGHFTSKIVGGTGDKAGCVMFDDTEMRTHKEIERARLVATYSAKQLNPEVGKDELDHLALAKPVRKAPVFPPMNRLPAAINAPGQGFHDFMGGLGGLGGLGGFGGGLGGLNADYMAPFAEAQRLIAQAIGGHRNPTTAERREQLLRAAERRARQE